MKYFVNDRTIKALCGVGLGAMLLTACSSMKAPAMAELAVSNAAVTEAEAAGAAQFAPSEIRAAQDKLSLANKAMADRDYEHARELASEAQVDATLAKSKTNSGKAEAAARTLEDDLRILREELDRANNIQR